MFKTEVIYIVITKRKHFTVFKCGRDCVICMKRCRASVCLYSASWVYIDLETYIDLHGGSSISTTPAER